MLAEAAEQHGGEFFAVEDFQVGDETARFGGLQREQVIGVQRALFQEVRFQKALQRVHALFGAGDAAQHRDQHFRARDADFVPVHKVGHQFLGRFGAFVGSAMQAQHHAGDDLRVLGGDGGHRSGIGRRRRRQRNGQLALAVLAVVGVNKALNLGTCRVAHRNPSLSQKHRLKAPPEIVRQNRLVRAPGPPLNRRSQKRLNHRRSGYYREKTELSRSGDA
jgi:hypothetical protein